MSSNMAGRIKLNTTLCRDLIWNSSLSWNTDNPNLTDCGQSLLSTAVCGLYLSLCLLACLTSSWPSRQQPGRRGRVMLAPRGGPRGKILIGARIVCYTLCLILSGVIPVLRRSLVISDLLSSCSLALACLASTISEFVLIRRMKHTTGLNSCFWLFLTLALIPGVKKALEQLFLGYQDLDNDAGQTSINITRWVVVLIATILQGIPNTSVLPVDTPIQNSASFLSTLLYSWFTGLVVTGWRRPLVQTDLPDLYTQINVSDNAKVLEEWQHKCRHEGKRLVLWKALLFCFSGPYWKGVALFLIRLVFVFTTPMLVKLIIQFVSEQDRPAWQGFFYAFLIFLCSFTAVIIDHQGLLAVCISANQMRSAVVAAVYRKSLRLKNESRQKYTTGQITNFMSVDAQRISGSIPFSYFMLTNPVELVICLTLVYLNIGWPMFAGVGVLLVLVPINLFTSQKAETILETQLEAKDGRIKMMNEILAGIKVLKLYAWEKPFMGIINKIRNSEVGMLISMAKLWALVNFTFGSVPFLTTLATFITYIFTSKESLQPDVIFVCMTLFNLLRNPIVIFPLALMDFIKLLVSIKRLDEFLNADELDLAGEEDGKGVQLGGTVLKHNIVEIQSGSLTWDTNQATILPDLNVNLKHGELVAVVGLVGSGKSSFLSAILGEMNWLNGSIKRSGTTAYMAQQAWIQNMTVKDNILFGSMEDDFLYKSVIQACCLASDLEQFPAGDRTEIGENGINLSGGQKQRIALARAVYKKADLYLLDDPLAALDAHVGAGVFRDVIGPAGILKDSTRILVTHNLAVLNQVDRILLLREGQIAEDGTYAELIGKGGRFSEFLKEHTKEETGPTAFNKKNQFERKSSVVSGGEPLSRLIRQSSEDAGEWMVRRRRTLSTCSSNLSASSDHNAVATATNIASSQRISSSYSQSNWNPVSQGKQGSYAAENHGFLADNDDNDIGPNTVLEDDIEVGFAGPMYNQQGQSTNKEPKDTDQQVHRLTEDEEVSTGSVKMAIYLKYIKSLGMYTWSFCLVMYFLCEGLLVGTNLALSKWADRPDKDKPAVTRNFIVTYSLLGVLNTVFFYFKELVMYLSAAKASRMIHENLLNRILHTPMSFFDMNPIGRIINRFSKDIDIVDQDIPFQIDDFLNCLAEVVGILFIISYSSPYFLIVILPISILYLALQKLYISSSRQLRRLDMITSSPIFSHFTETVTGASSIRAFGMTERFVEESINLVSTNNKCNWSSLNSNRWLGVRLENLGNLIVLATALLAVLSRGIMTPGMAGLSISYALMSTETLNWMVRMICGLETNSISLERIFEYCERPEEAAWDTEEDCRAQLEDWPQSGEIEFVDVSVSYRDSLPPVLKNLSFHIRSGEKIGICGRTGAGKSSLSLLIFRIMETSKGRVLIDGIDIGKLGLQCLRKQLTIIPQDPVLFSTTLRLNLDPAEEFADSELHDTLDLVGLPQLKATLHQEVQEKGENLSVGQRQLLCLARAILRKTKILVLDEATAAIDVETDNKVQKIIRDEFKDCTVLTIAHRINTILDSDRVLILEAGQLLEFASPVSLLNTTSSTFHSLAKESGLA